MARTQQSSSGSVSHRMACLNDWMVAKFSAKVASNLKNQPEMLRGSNSSMGGSPHVAMSVCRGLGERRGNSGSPICRKWTR